jgi:hypothetical protein
MNGYRIELKPAAALACAIALAVSAATPARADSYDWWLFEQIGLTMNQAKAAKRAEQPKNALRVRAEEAATPGSPAAPGNPPEPSTAQVEKPGSSGVAPAGKKP